MDDLSTYQWKITAKEVLMGREISHPLSSDLMQNLARLLAAVNYIRYKYGKPLIVSSGYRPGEFNKKAGGAPNSSHLTCEAVDFADPAPHEFRNWCLTHIDELEKAGLYMENPTSTPTWVHLDLRVRKSRIFNP